MKGLTIYTGPSRINGKPVIAVATLSSSNRKTGPMIQTWIMPGDVAPNTAIKTGQDEAVCGSCLFRPRIARELRKVADEGDQIGSCYVNVRAPVSVYKAHARGNYTEGSLSVVAGTWPVRAGGWGDPGAVPFDVWRPLRGKAHTGYTARWRELSADASPWASVFMASCRSPRGREQANALGWRTYRVRMWRDGEPEPLLSGEMVCPASREAKEARPGRFVFCATCGLCDGKASESDKRKDIAIIDHGPGAPAWWRTNKPNSNKREKEDDAH